MRLIDADELIKSIEQSRNNNPHKDCHIKRNHDIEHDHFIKMVYEHPTAFNKESVIEDLEALEETESLNMNDDVAMAYTYALAIVEKGGIE